MPSQLKSVKIGRKAKVVALLPIKQARWPAKSQVMKASLLLTLQLQALWKGSFVELKAYPSKSTRLFH